MRPGFIYFLIEKGPERKRGDCERSERKEDDTLTNKKLTEKEITQVPFHIVNALSKGNDIILKNSLDENFCTTIRYIYNRNKNIYEFKEREVIFGGIDKFINSGYMRKSEVLDEVLNKVLRSQEYFIDQIIDRGECKCRKKN